MLEHAKHENGSVADHAACQVPNANHYLHSVRLLVAQDAGHLELHIRQMEVWGSTIS